MPERDEGKKIHFVALTLLPRHFSKHCCLLYRWKTGHKFAHQAFTLLMWSREKLVTSHRNLSFHQIPTSDLAWISKLILRTVH